MKKTFVRLVKERKFQIFFLIYILLVIPVISPIAQNIPTRDLIPGIFVNLGLVVVLFTLSLFVKAKTEKISASLLLLITLVPGVIFLAYLLFAHVLLLEDSIISLFETNPEESKEFVAYYMSPWVILGVLAYAAIPIVLICRMKRAPTLNLWRNKWLFSGCIALLFLTISVEKLSDSVYFLNFYKIFVNYKIRTNVEEKEIVRRQTLPFPVTSLLKDRDPQTIVVVIGESETRLHLSLYGYFRQTNPLLSQEKELLAYENVTSPQVHTIPVIRSVMSFSEEDKPELLWERPSLFELFNRAGYETYLISNQPYGGSYKTSYDILLEQAQHKVNLSLQKKPDGVVLKSLQTILSEPTRHSRLIVIHLIGSHMAYEFRYPADFNRFDHRKDGLLNSNAPYMVESVKTMIDQYDNTVLYNDYILSEIIRQLRGHNGENALVYFSDHGEEVYDYRDFAGHAYEKVSAPMCEIPFLVWMSDLYKANRADLFFDKNRPWSTADFMYSISDLAGLRYPGYDDTRSLFSLKFKPRERSVGDLTYEDVLDLTDKLERRRDTRTIRNVASRE